jgi:hypothetical protein
MVMLVAYAAFVILSLVIGIIFFICNVKRFSRSLKKGEYTLSFDQWMNSPVLNPGMWVFLALIALLFVANLLL